MILEEREKEKKLFKKSLFAEMLASPAISVLIRVVRQDPGENRKRKSCLLKHSVLGEEVEQLAGIPKSSRREGQQICHIHVCG